MCKKFKVYQRQTKKVGERVTEFRKGYPQAEKNNQGNDREREKTKEKREFTTSVMAFASGTLFSGLIYLHKV